MTEAANGPEKQTAAAPLRFGAFELDPRTGELRRSGVLIHLQPQPLRLLELLARRRGELVTREEIQQELWSGETFVDFERSINICVMQIRAALGDDAGTPRFIETLPRRGYRFVASVERAAEPRAVTPAVDAAQARKIAVMRSLLFMLIGLTTVLLAGALWRFANRSSSTPTAAPRVMLAVLPFENLTGNAEMDYVSDGMTEELIAQLGRVSPERLGVIARTSAMRYRGAKESVAKIGGELGVQYVIEGSVRLEKSRAWITVQLIRAADQTHLWAETFEPEAPSVFTMQQSVALQAAAETARRLLAPNPPQPASPAGTTVTAAADALARGRYLFHRGGSESIAAAVEQFERAVAADPGFAEAHAALADALQLGAMVGVFTVAESAPRARAAAANAADERLSETHAARGLVAMWFDWNPKAAAAHFEKAIAANPSNAEAHHDYAWVLVALGRDEDAVREIRAAQALDPVSPRANMDLGWIYLGIRRWDDALRHCTRMVEIEPRVFEPAQSCLETAYLAKQDTAGAAAAALRQFERDPAHAARLAEWRKLPPQEQLRAVWRFRLEQRLSSATVRKAYRASGLHLQLGEKEAALRYLEQALAEREMMLVMLHRSPEYDSLRNEPRFQAVQARVTSAEQK